MAVPKKILSLVDLEARSRVEVRVERGRLIVEPATRPRYTLAELLSRCRRSALAPQRQARAWLQARSVGREEL